MTRSTWFRVGLREAKRRLRRALQLGDTYAASLWNEAIGRMVRVSNAGGVVRMTIVVPSDLLS